MKWFLQITLALSLALSLAGTRAQAQPAGPVYVVQPGDTFFGIARQFGVTVEALQAANPTVSANALPVGGSLLIPGYAGVSGTLGVHLLEPGESLESVAFRFGLEVDALARLNRVLNPDRLYINQPVIVPEPSLLTPLATGVAEAWGPGQSPLARLAGRGQNPWAVAAANRLAHPGALPARPVLYVPGGDQPLKALAGVIRDVQAWPFPAIQGGTLVVRVTTSAPADLEGALGEWPLNFLADPAAPNTYYALHGVPRLTDPNLYALTLGVRGEPAALAQALPVRAGQYATDPPLTVDPATLDPAAVEPEFQRVKALVTQVTPERAWTGPFLLPSVGVIRSRFGSLRSYNGGPYDSFHGGVDFSGGEDRPITAAAPGTVVLAEQLTVRGGSTIIDHGWGVFTGYWHQSRIEVQVGQRVEAGQLIGYNGATGRVTGPHLHWEVWVNGYQVEPLAWTEAAFP